MSNQSRTSGKLDIMERKKSSRREGVTRIKNQESRTKPQVLPSILV